MSTVDTSPRAAGPARLADPARLAALLGGVLLLVAPFLAWAYRRVALDDLTHYLSPSPLQWFSFVLAVLLVAALTVPLLPTGRRRGRLARWFSFARAAKAAARASLIYVAVMLAAAALALGGLVALEPGAWVALAGGVLGVAGTWRFPDGDDPTARYVRTASWLQILGIVAAVAAVLFAAVYGLDQDDPGVFIAFALFVGGAVYVGARLGALAWLATAAAQNRRVLTFAAFVVAFAFPFTQDGSDANMSVAVGVLVFAATAMGLNIVVGLAGLLDLGYIAFLGAGAFTAAALSESAFATLSWKPPFLVVVLISGTVSALFGVLIGSPTLRVSGDYLAIVTLAFGEIFRITMNNLDGNDGPDLTHGSNGIPGIPDLQILGFDFGEAHTILGIEIGRFANYYWLLLVVLGLIIAVFTNLNHSRIGRGWVAIREDERAAEAMGVNVFGLKVLAFAGGAFLAGVAGSVKAHVDVSVTPDQYIFMESAFLVAGIVLGGMGTIGGVLIGASVLKLLPEKLRFFDDYRLLLFGLLLIVMMRFRPEGLLPDERRQLEFHIEDEELAEEIAHDVERHVVPSLAGAQDPETKPDIEEGPR